jgi:hypothetical protein
MKWDKDREFEARELKEVGRRIEIVVEVRVSLMVPNRAVIFLENY